MRWSRNATAAGFAFLASAHGALPTMGVTLLGLGLGTEIDLIAFLVSRYFGQRSFGQLYGYCFMAFGFGSSAVTQGLFLVLVGRAQAPVWDVSARHHIERKKPMPPAFARAGFM